jgi:hypothetical protein
MAAFAAAALSCGSAQAGVILNLSFSTDFFGVTGSFSGAFDSIPEDTLFEVSAASVNCQVQPSSSYSCDRIFLFNNMSGFQDGLQINLLTSSGDFGPGFAFSFDKLALVTPGTYTNTNGFGQGHSATLRVTSTQPTAPVPEPATWAIMLAGFFGLGAALRQRGSTAAA